MISITSEVDPDKLSKARRVVVPCSFGIAVRLQDWVGCHDLVLKRNLLLNLLAAGARGSQSQVSDHFLCVLRLSGTRLAGDQHRIVLLV